VLGVYDTKSKFVTVGFDQDWATDHAINQPWGTDEVQGVFYGPYGPSGQSESDIATALENRDIEALEMFVSSYLSNGRWASNGDTSTLVKFSYGEAGGTAQATASPVPIPSAVLLMGSGLIGLLIIRRKEKA